MDKVLKKQLLLITFGVILFALLMNFSVLADLLSDVAKLLAPVVAGLIVAFVLNVPIEWLEELFRRFYEKGKKKKPFNEKAVFLTSLLIVLLIIVLILALIITLVLPRFIETVKSTVSLIKNKMPDIIAFLESYNINTEQLKAWTSDIQWDKIFQNAGSVLNIVAGAASSTFSGITTSAFAFIIAIYVLMSKKALCRQSKKLLYAHLKPQYADSACRISKLVKNTYSKFLSGQVAEAFILSVLMFVGLTIFRIPYAGLIAVLAGLFSFVPYVGAFLACAVGAFFIMLTNPVQALVCIIVYNVIQFIENQFIYPHVVGTSVGLSPLWTLLAALLGGKLFGLLGMIFAIPLMAVLYTLIKEYTEKKLSKKAITVE